MDQGIECNHLYPRMIQDNPIRCTNATAGFFVKKELVQASDVYLSCVILRLFTGKGANILLSEREGNKKSPSRHAVKGSIRAGNGI